MPDLGERGKALLGRIRRDKADLPGQPGEVPAEPVAGQSEVDTEVDESRYLDLNPDVFELVDLLRSVLESRRPPPGPIAEPWSFGIGTVLAEYPKVPKRLRGVVGKLDRFGGVAIGPERLAFDRDDVEWVDVTEVRTRHAVDYLLGDAVQRQVEQLPLPPFPGRTRLIDTLGKAVLTIMIAGAEKEADDRRMDLRIPAEIEYRGRFGRSRTLSAGVLAAVVLADPVVGQCVTDSARARGILVKAADDEGYADAAERAVAVKARVAALRTELDRFGRLGRGSKESAD